MLFGGAGTTGTLMGCARWFHEWYRPVQVVAIDAVGSVTFGGEPGRRMIPGLGMNVRPPLLDESMVDAAERAGTLGPGSLLVESSSGNLGVALSMIAASKGYGFLFGGSTGTVVSGAVEWLAGHDTREYTAVARSPRTSGM